MDDVLVILLYLGGLLLIGLVRSISKSGKKRSSLPASFSKPAVEESEDRIFDPHSFLSFLDEPPIVQPAVMEEDFIEEKVSYKPLYDFDNKEINDKPEVQIYASDKAETFILGDFDPRAGIIYSEIFKRPEY